MNSLLAAAFTLCASTCFAADPTFESPSVGISRESADLIGRAENALTRYAHDCAASNSSGSNELADDAVIEYATTNAGRLLSVDAASEKSCWEGAAQMSQPAGPRIRFYPTSYPHTVFVEINNQDGSAAARDSLLMLEMSGDRISRIRDLTANVATTESRMSSRR